MEKEWKFAETVIILGTNFLLFYFILHSFFLIEKNRQFQRFTMCYDLTFIDILNDK